MWLFSSLIFRQAVSIKIQMRNQYNETLMAILNLHAKDILNSSLILKNTSKLSLVYPFALLIWNNPVSPMKSCFTALAQNLMCTAQNNWCLLSPLLYFQSTMRFWFTVVHLKILRLYDGAKALCILRKPCWELEFSLIPEVTKWYFLTMMGCEAIVLS